MDINLLVLNVGNSRLAVSVFIAGGLEHVTYLPHTDRAAWPAAIEAAWKMLAPRDQAAVAAVSVNPMIAEPLELLVSQRIGQKIQWVGRELELPINVLTQPPADTGVDRIVNVAAAYEQMGKACVVVDAGTAVTVDFCNDNGDFLGGAIAPGVNMMLQALHEKTARLPLVPFQPPGPDPGNTTSQAMCQGVYHAIRGLVKEAVESHAMHVGAWPEIIATGGDAEQLFGGWEIIHAISKNLTLYGIALAYTNHHIRHEEA